jgi:hypothetical protein
MQTIGVQQQQGTGISAQRRKFKSEDQQKLEN